MNFKMSFKKEGFSSLVSAMVELLVGVLLLINPVGFTAGIIIGLGVLLVAVGIFSTAQYFITAPLEAARQQGLARGLILMLAGAFCAMCSDWFVAIFPLLTMLYGVLLLVVSAAKIQLAVDMLRLKRDNWLFAAIAAAVSAVVAILVLVNPFGATTLVWAVIGLSLIAGAVLDVLAAFLRRSAGL